jgi:hypothetical protein
MMVVIAHGHTQDLLGLVLLDHEAIQMLLDLPGSLVELKPRFPGRTLRFLRDSCMVDLFGWLNARLLKMLLDELGHLPLKFLR